MGNESMRDRLLGQDRTDPSALELYRKDMEMNLQEQETGLRREQRMTSVLWIFIVLLSTAFLLIGGMRNDRIWFGVLACFWFLFGSVFLMRMFVNRSRVELLKELKGVEMRVLELQQSISKRG